MASRRCARRKDMIVVNSNVSICRVVLGYLFLKTLIVDPRQKVSAVSDGAFEKVNARTEAMVWDDHDPSAL